MNKLLLILLLSPIVFADNLVIEDFENNRAQWDAVSDQVMGGLSEIKFTKLSDENINFSFGPGGSTETIKCKDCGIKKLRQKR